MEEPDWSKYSVDFIHLGGPNYEIFVSVPSGCRFSSKARVIGNFDVRAVLANFRDQKDKWNIEV